LQAIAQELDLALVATVAASLAAIVVPDNVLFEGGSG